MEMFDIKTLADLQITIFLMMAAGYLLTRLGVLPTDARKTLTSILINFIIPCNIIVSFLMEFNMEIFLDTLAILLISIGIQVATPLLGLVLYPNSEPRQLAVLRYSTVVSNAGYMGNPIVYDLFGVQGLLYASIYLIPQRIVVWAAGVSYFTGAKDRHIVKKILTHPCIVAVLVGILLMASQTKIPSGLEKTLTYGSNCVMAISMILIGSILSDIKVRSLVTGKILWYCFVRLILIPALALAVCRLANVSAMVTVIAVMLAGMPAGSTTAILAAQYGGDDTFAAKVIFVSTALSLFSVPALCILAGAV